MSDAATALLRPTPDSHGGIAVWVGVDDRRPMSAIRIGVGRDGDRVELDVVDVAMMLASLHIGVYQVAAVMADRLGVSVEDLNTATSIAAETLSPHAKFRIEPR
jgi:hypothetical protein